MRDYGKVHTSFWSSSTISGLSDDARMLALYLMTSPHTTIAGVFRLPDGYVCEDLKWPIERVSEGFAELFAKGFANRCETTKWVWIVKHLEWNPPENPNQRKAAKKCADSVPTECLWKQEFMDVCAAFFGENEEPFGNPCGTLPQPEAGTGTEAGTEVKARATRLPAEWTLPDEWEGYCRKARPDLDPKAVAENFADFWHAKPGQGGTKLDWQATWRTWVRNQKTALPNRTGLRDGFVAGKGHTRPAL